MPDQYWDILTLVPNRPIVKSNWELLLSLGPMTAAVRRKRDVSTSALTKPIIGFSEKMEVFSHDPIKVVDTKLSMKEAKAAPKR